LKGDKEWKFDDVENTAVFTTRQVINENMPILFVFHDEDDGAWQFHHDNTPSIEDAMIVSLYNMVSLDNTLNQLFDLPIGWYASRKDSYDAWQRRKIEI